MVRPGVAHLAVLPNPTKDTHKDSTIVREGPLNDLHALLPPSPKDAAYVPPLSHPIEGHFSFAQNQEKLLHCLALATHEKPIHTAQTRTHAQKGKG